MSIIGAVIVPHPPLLLPEVGKGREAKIHATMEAMCRAAEQVARWEPEVLIVASPHTILYADYFHIAPGSRAFGSMAVFQAPQVRLEARYDVSLREAIIEEAQSVSLPAGTLGQRDPELDHGILVPLYFLRKAGVNCPIVRMGLSGLPALDHYRLGQCVARAVDRLGRRAIFVASGDLSHKLKKEGPYGYAVQGPQFDEAAVEAMAQGDFLRFLSMDPTLCAKAAQCGLPSFQMMAGAMDGIRVKADLLSYEGPFGVGYAVALFQAGTKDKNRCFASVCEQRQRQRIAMIRADEDAWVRLARLSLETYVKTGKPLPLPNDLDEALLQQRAPVFVSLHKNGELRGCIGTTKPCHAHVAAEIIANAVAAGTRDPRFPKVKEQELDQIEYNVDVLGEAQRVTSFAQLDPKRYGVIVTSGRKRGLLLPDLEQVDTVEQQLTIAKEKGGIDEDEPCLVERFEVVRHT